MPFLVAIAPVRRGVVYSFRLRAAVREERRTGRVGCLLKRECLGFPAIDLIVRANVDTGGGDGSAVGTNMGHNRGIRGGILPCV
jgi:hypothetical protein